MQSCHFAGPEVDHYWQQLDEKKKPVQRFDDFEDVSIQFSNIDSLSLQVDVLEPLYDEPQSTYIQITELETQTDITSRFSFDGFAEDGYISDIGIFSSSFFSKISPKYLNSTSIVLDI